MGMIGIAGASGTFKGVFVHGVLTAFERAGFYADAYAGASSSTLSCCAAAARISEEVGLRYWLDAREDLESTKGDLSEVVLRSIGRYAPVFIRRLFNGNSARLLIAASRVNNAGAAEETQGPSARKLGRRLLIDALRQNDRWARENLDPWCFDSAAAEGEKRLSGANFSEVAYASTRMLHAWPIPAAVNGAPFVDASYTSACPAEELRAVGCDTVIMISPEPGPIYKDIFRVRTLGGGDEMGPFHAIMPDRDPKEFGVDFTAASAEGLEEVYGQGIAKGREFIEQRAALRNSAHTRW